MQADEGGDMSAGDTDKEDKRLAQWMGYSDVLCAGMEEIAVQLERIAEITERQAGESFDHLEVIAKMSGYGRLFAGAPPKDEREQLIEQNIQALLAGYVRADYLHQALGAMAGLLRGYASEANSMAAETFVDKPAMRSAALEVAERFRAIHDKVGLSDLRRRMLGRTGGLEITDDKDESREPPVAAFPSDAPSFTPAGATPATSPAPDNGAAAFGMAVGGALIGAALSGAFDAADDGGDFDADSGGDSGGSDSGGGDSGGE
jgi:hypothetical protein